MGIHVGMATHYKVSIYSCHQYYSIFSISQELFLDSEWIKCLSLELHLTHDVALKVVSPQDVFNIVSPETLRIKYYLDLLEKSLEGQYNINWH